MPSSVLKSTALGAAIGGGVAGALGAATSVLRESEKEHPNYSRAIGIGFLEGLPKGIIPGGFLGGGTHLYRTANRVIDSSGNSFSESSKEIRRLTKETAEAIRNTDRSIQTLSEDLSKIVKPVAAAMEASQKASKKPGMTSRVIQKIFGDWLNRGAAKTAMPFLEQNRSEKVKEIYRALVRDHPAMSAEMKARIAIRRARKTAKSRRSPKHGGPPYKAPLTYSSDGGHRTEDM